MSKLTLESPRFFSPQDESYFFAWLSSIKGVSGVQGEDRSMCVNINSRLSEVSLRELLSLHKRYLIPMRQLAVFVQPSNESWLLAKEA